MKKWNPTQEEVEKAIELVEVAFMIADDRCVGAAEHAENDAEKDFVVRLIRNAYPA